MILSCLGSYTAFSCRLCAFVLCLPIRMVAANRSHRVRKGLSTNRWYLSLVGKCFSGLFLPADTRTRDVSSNDYGCRLLQLKLNRFKLRMTASATTLQCRCWSMKRASHNDQIGMWAVRSISVTPRNRYICSLLSVYTSSEWTRDCTNLTKNTNTSKQTNNSSTATHPPSRNSSSFHFSHWSFRDFLRSDKRLGEQRTFFWSE